QAHDDRVPQLARAAPVVPGQVALALEPETLVEGDGGGVVGPDLEGDLVGAGLAGLVDGLGQEGRPDPPAPPAGGHGHAQLGNAVAGQVQAELSHHLAGGLGDEDDRVLALDVLDHAVAAALDVDRGLGGDPAALAGHLDEHGHGRVDILQGGQPARRRGGPPRSRALAGSATRSSGCSTPTDSRTRSAGTSASVPATLAWVISPGSSIRLSTPPRLSARVNPSVAAASRLAASTPPAGRKATMPPKAAICLAASSCPGSPGRPG